MSQTPTPPVPAPRFSARNLNLSLLRSPNKFIKLRYLLQPITYFAHVPIQLFFDFNVVYILVQYVSHWVAKYLLTYFRITKFPTPLAPGVPNTSPTPSWLFALILYLLATLLWLVGVVLVYEIAWSFWRRWRVKRPGMLGIFSSRPARKLVGMGSYDRFCFLEYVQRGAWTDRTELDLLLERDREIEEMERDRRREAEEGESMGGGWEGKEALRTARLEAERLDREVVRNAEADSDSSSVHSFTLFQKVQRLNYKQGLIEWAWNRSQNLPTVSLLVPRACIAFIIILTFTKTNPLTLAALASAGSSSIFASPAGSSLYPSTNSPVRRDQTFFSGRDGTLTSYAKAVLWIDCIWAFWRTLILIGAYISLWIASGQSCAGVCGPRYRWEEHERQEWEDATNAGLHEKYGSGSRRHLSMSGESTIGPDRETGDIADQLGWQWRENTRRRVREAYEFCLLTPLPHRRRGSTPAPLAAIGMGKDKDVEGVVEPEPLTALEQALLTSRHQGRKGLVPDLFDQPTHEGGLRDSIQLVPPSTHLPVTELPYPFPAYRGATSLQQPRIGRKDSIPFPNELDEPEGAEDVSQMEDEYVNEEDYLDGEVDEMGYLPERAASASLSSLGRPLSSGQGRSQYGQRSGSSVHTGPTSYSYSQQGQSPRNSGYKSTSSKSNSGDQSRRKSSGKSSGSHYSPRTHKSSGSQQSPGTDSSNQQKLSNILPPPSASSSARYGGNGDGERRRAVSATQLSRIVPSPMPSEGLGRSPHAASSGALHDVAPEPYASEGEHDGDDHDDHEERASGGHEHIPGEEHEDSLGLLSNAPSHQGSLAALRARASSFTESLQRIRTRSQGASSHHSNSNSNSSGRQRARARSAAASAANGGGTSSSNNNSGNGRRERTESHAMSTMSGRSASRSRTSSIVPVIGARYTSSRPEYTAARRPTEFGEVEQHYEQEQQDYVPDWIHEPVPPLPTQSTTPPRDNNLPRPRADAEDEERVRGASTAPSERTIQPLPPRLPARRLTAHENVSLEHLPDISTARESFVTLPATIDTGSTPVYREGERGGASSGYLHEQVP